MYRKISAFAFVAAATVMTSGIAHAGCKVVKYTYGC